MSTTYPESHIDLDVAIELLINLGERDPLNIMRKLVERYGEDWAREEVAERAHDYIIILARQAVGNARRRAEAGLVSGNPSTELAIRLSRVWIPYAGYKVLDECTSADFRVRADWYRKFIVAAQRRETWCRQVANLIDEEGVETLGEVTRPLPPLPAVEEDGFGELPA